LPKSQFVQVLTHIKNLSGKRPERLRGLLANPLELEKLGQSGSGILLQGIHWLNWFIFLLENVWMLWRVSGKFWWDMYPSVQSC